MPLSQIGIFFIGAAIIAAVLLGAWAAHFSGAVRNALVIWVLFLLAWYLWGPPLPYVDLTSNAFAALGSGVALVIVASLAHWLWGLSRR
jgi:hypothetical protein